jgi:CHAT domain-containing protein/tetratricopeptide (TPR) repeat protein
VRKHKIILVAFLLLPLVVRGDSSIQGPLKLLAEADRFAFLNNWPKATPRYAEAESLFAQAGNGKGALAARLGYLWSTVDAGVSGSADREIASYLENPLVKGDPALTLRALVAKAVLNRNTNEIAGRETWQSILDSAKAIGDERWEGRAKAELGQILYMGGDIQSATAMLREGIVSQYLRLDIGAAVYYTAMVGNGFVEAGRPETALEYCNTALKAAFFVGDIGFPFLAYQGKARALIALNREGEAQEVLDEALQRARSDGNYMALSQLLVVAGTAAASHNKPTATRYLLEATNLSQSKGFHHVFAWSSFELARLYRDSGNLDGAEVLSSRTVTEMRELEDKYHLPEHLALFADLSARKGQIARADELYSEAADVIDGLLVNVNQRQLKGSLISTLSEAYLGHFELVATKFSEPAKAFQIIEQARGRALADTLRGESESLASGTEASADAQREINRIQLALLHETTRDGRQALLDDLFRVEQFLSPARRNITLLNSASNRLKPVALEQLQRSLGRDEMVLEYVLGETQSYCLRITAGASSIVIIPHGRKAIERLIDDYLEAVRSRKSQNEFARVPFGVLMEPVVSGQSPTRLIIVPDGKLNLLPFDALQDSEGRFVLQSHVVTYAPSATVLHLLREPRPSSFANRSFLGVGGVAYSSSMASGSGGKGPAPSSTNVADFFGLDSVIFPDLPGSTQEVVSAATIIGGANQLLLEGKATEAEFKAQPLSEFQVIHLAVHGLANSEFPDRAALVLGSSAATGDDGLLQVREIRDLPLRAELVTLSACDTGAGKLLGQEGIASLERAFLLAGAKSVIASLWPADDTFTIALMKRMYQHLAEGTDKGTALRQAKLDLLKEFGDQALPVYWAGFTLVGDGSTPIFKSSSK